MSLTQELTEFVKVLAKKWYEENKCWPRNIDKSLTDKLYAFWTQNYDIKESELVAYRLRFYKGTDLFTIRNRTYQLFNTYFER
jgi:hypothetical protein